MNEYLAWGDEEVAKYASLIAAFDFEGNLARLLRRLLSTTPIHGLVVELGFGVGRQLSLLSEFSPCVEGLERAPALLRYAQRHAPPGVKLHLGDARSLPYEERRVSVILASSLFSILHRDGDAQLALEECERVLAPGGLSIIIESLVVGTHQPRQEHPHRALHQRLEGFGYLLHHVKTDARFEDEAGALEVLTPFFGPRVGLALTTGANEGVCLRELSGVWVRRA